jgi:hypothetical protein
MASEYISAGMARARDDLAQPGRVGGISPAGGLSEPGRRRADRKGVRAVMGGDPAQAGAARGARPGNGQVGPAASGVSGSASSASWTGRASGSGAPARLLMGELAECRPMLGLRPGDQVIGHRASPIPPLAARWLGTDDAITAMYPDGSRSPGFTLTRDLAGTTLVADRNGVPEADREHVPAN